jgi:membrane protein implicated in regulation of membrane protease activity
MIAELFTPGFLLASFGIGAFGGSLLAFLDYELRVQLLAFSIVTLILLTQNFELSWMRLPTNGELR